MTTLYITRHGETIWNVEGRMQGWKDSPLTELGMAQAAWLKERLNEVEFPAIYSSSSNRTFRTAEIIKGHRKIEIFKDDNLREIGLGNWEGMLIDDIRKINPEQISNFWENPHLYYSISGESFNNVKSRAMMTIKNIINKHKNENILIVTHSVVLKLIMSFYTNTSLEKLWNPPFIHQASLSIVKVEEDKADIILHGDISYYRNR